MKEARPTVEIDDETPIWRYMDLQRFVSMLATGTLWFTKAALFEDPYEGFSEARPLKAPSNDDGPRLVSHFESGQETMITIPQMYAKWSERSAEQFESARARLYVNSWCLAKQSMAMWEIYGASGRGIALRSSVGRYRRAARFMVSEPHYRFGKIEYQSDLAECRDLMLDFADGVIPLPGIGLGERILNVGFHKRDCFQYEEEWRCALYQDEHPESRGLPIRFDLSELIAEVFVGPRAEEFFLKVVSSIMDKFDLQKPLNRSRLLEAPSRAASSTELAVLRRQVKEPAHETVGGSSVNPVAVGYQASVGRT